MADVMTTDVKARASARRAPAAGAIAGFVAGLLMILTAMFRSVAGVMEFWYPLRLIGATYWDVEGLIGGAGVLAAGAITHFAVSIVLGIIFAFFVRMDTPGGVAVLAGLFYGIIVWAVMTFVFLPLVNETMRARVELVPWWWFFYHLVFGAFLGLTPLIMRAMGRPEKTAPRSELRAGHPTEPPPHTGAI